MVLYYSDEWESLRGSPPSVVGTLPSMFPSRPTPLMKGTKRWEDGPMNYFSPILALARSTWDPRSPNLSPSKLALVASPAAPDFCSGPRPSEGIAQSAVVTTEHPCRPWH